MKIYADRKINALLLRPGVGVVGLGLLLCLACKKEAEPVNNPNADINSMVVDPSFNYKTTNEVQIQVRAKDASGATLSLPNVEIYTKAPEEGGELVAQGGTGDQGELSMVKSLPAYLKEVVIVSNYAGLLSQVTVPVVSGTVDYTFETPDQNTGSGTFGENAGGRTTVSLFTYLGTYNNQGVPNYREPVNDVIDAQFLKDVNATLPESRPVPTFHPEYLAQGNATDVRLSADADIWVTFVSEGAGWLNALGYYTYPLNNPPATANDIKQRFIVFPNVSFSGSGGGLASGNKVKIGHFSAGTGIGWLLVTNGWTGSQVGNGNYIHYSNPAFNQEPNPAIRQHNVLIDDSNRGRVLLAFEDVRRDNTPINCDQDFNDAIFYVTANSYAAIETNALPNIKLTATDTDKDGVPDEFDNYPGDAARAYNNYSPSAKTFGTLAYEDLWPSKGDYDLNDLVVNYQFNSVTNAQNKVVEVKSKLLVSAIGASFHNGFGIQLPVSSGEVASVTGTSLKHGYISLAGNGTEAGQNKATIIAFDDAFDHITRVSGYFNTQMDQPKATSDTLLLTITFTTPVLPTALGAAPFNPFIIVNKQRDYEVHLPGKEPTSKASTALLGTHDDNTITAQQLYYKTKKNLPFALNLPVGFAYPTESTPITSAHLKFAAWAQSGGSSYPDWYLNLPQYRNTADVYSK